MPEAFHFDVGERERHRVDFSRDRVWGEVTIRVDGSVLDTGLHIISPGVTRRDLHIESAGITKRYELSVGQAERHTVVIEQARALLMPGLRKSSYRVLIDGQLATVVPGST